MTQYHLFYHPDIKKEDLPPIPDNIKKRIKKAIEERLSVEPLKYGKPLTKGLRPYRKLRVGDYRVIYKLQDTDILILKIGHRKEIYNKAHLRTNAQNA